MGGSMTTTGAFGEADAAIRGADDPTRRRSAALARAFRTALAALSGPGAAHRMPTLDEGPIAPLSPAATSLLLVLSDADAPCWLAPALQTEDAARRLAFATGAATAATPETAAFLVGAWAELTAEVAARAPIGDPEYPDRGATLVIEAAGLPDAAAPAVAANSGAAAARLSGPGLAAPRVAAVDLGAAEVSAEFWRWMAMNTARFPLGLDVFVCAGDRLLGLPRSLRIEPMAPRVDQRRP